MKNPFETAILDGHKAVIRHIFRNAEVEVGSRWTPADGSANTVTVVSVDLGRAELVYEDVRGSRIEKDIFSFQCHYCLVVEPLSLPWFAEAFDGYEVPGAFRRFSEAFCRQFDIRGVCDPMYVANSAAMQVGRGDGRGTFHAHSTVDEDNRSAALSQLARHLAFAYGSNVGQDGETAVRELIAKAAPELFEKATA